MPGEEEKVHQVNSLAGELEAIYHQAAWKLGLSDSVLMVLYGIHDLGDKCKLYDICMTSSLNKQTINSAIRKLEQEEILYLEQETGRTKRVCLTEKGRGLLQQTAGRLYEAERNALRDWPEEEFAQYLALMRKYNRCIRTEIEKMEERTL